MADTICPHCGHQRDASATTQEWVCPACRKKYFDRVGKHETAKPWREQLARRALIPLLVVFLIVFAQVIFPIDLFPESEASRLKRVKAEESQKAYEELQRKRADRLADEYTVLKTCMDAVKSALKAPSTAKFSEFNTILKADNTAWTFGHVDAQNSFGAMLRSDVSCDSKKTGNYWQTTAKMH